MFLIGVEEVAGGNGNIKILFKNTTFLFFRLPTAIYVYKCFVKNIYSVVPSSEKGIKFTKGMGVKNITKDLNKKDINGEQNALSDT